MARRSTVTSRRLGRRLAALRGKRDAREVAAEMGWDPSFLSKVEHGERRIKPADLRALLTLYEASDHERRGLVALNSETTGPNWLHEYSAALPEDFGAFLDLERHATVISEYSQLHVPGLLQTAEFARAQMRQTDMTVDSDDEIESRVEARLARQKILDRTHPPRIRWVLEEAVLRRQVGSRQVMRDQLTHILEVSDRLTNSLVVVRYNAGAHAAHTSFVLFELDHDDPPVAYHELLTGSVYLDKTETVAKYMTAFESALTAALSPSQSMQFIAAVRKELE